MATVAAAVGSCVLLGGSFLFHLRGIEDLRQTLLAHRLLSRRLIPVAATLLLGVEGVLACALILSLVIAPAWQTVVLAAVGTVFVAMSSYLEFAGRLGSSASATCGCGLADLPLGRKAVLRALALGVVVLLVAIATPSAGASLTGTRMLIASCIGITAAILIMYLPAVGRTQFEHGVEALEL